MLDITEATELASTRDEDRPLSDAERFTDLCRRHQHRILGYALRRTGNVDDAADVTSEVFLTAWRRIGDVPEDAGEALPWLYATARRTLANHHRGEHRRSRLAQRVAGQLSVTVDEPGAEDSLGVAREAFQSLSAADQELLTLVGWEGLDRDAIATVLGTSRAAVRVRLHRARRRFAAALADTGFDADVLHPERDLPDPRVPQRGRSN